MKRFEIIGRETEQMNRSSAWFEKHYQGMGVKRLIVHPACVIASAASLTDECKVVRETELKRFVKHLREFFKVFEASDFEDMSVQHRKKVKNLK